MADGQPAGTETPTPQRGLIEVRNVVPPEIAELPLVGLTVAEALDALEEADPFVNAWIEPFFVNDDEVERDSDRVLQPGDILTVTDP